MIKGVYFAPFFKKKMKKEMYVTVNIPIISSKFSADGFPFYL